MEINVPISIGEMLDKMSILHIKISKIENEEKLIHLNKELDLLNSHAEKVKEIDEVKFEEFFQSLLDVNSKLWEIEDDIRDLEGIKKFDDSFIQVARSVYITNDLRFKIKSEINNYFGSSIVEQKELKEY